MRIDYVEKKLSNGIKVYFYKDKNLKRTFVSYSVNYGTLGYYDYFYYRDKKYHVSPAMAHFLEHMLIETSSNGNMLHRLIDKGYETNGATYSDLTTYYFLGIDSEKEIDKSIREFILMLECPVWNNNNIENVKHAVCEELKMKSDNKYQIAISNNNHNLYNNFDAVPIDNNVLASIETTNDITLNDAKVAYDAYYNDDNKFILIAGNIDIDKKVELLESLYKDIKPHKNEMREYDYGDDFKVRCEKDYIYREVDADIGIVTYKFKNDFKIDKFKYRLYLYLYLSMKMDPGVLFIDDLLKKEIINSPIEFNINFFKDVISIRFILDSFVINSALNMLNDYINIVKVNKEDFEIYKRELVANNLRKKDYIYNVFRNFPLNIEFTKHFDITSIINELNYDEMISIVSRLKFDLKTVTILTNKK